MVERGPFDPSDPRDAIADMFRRQVAELATAAEGAKAYERLGPQGQLEAFMAGVLTGLIGVCFCHIKPDGRDELMKAIKKYLPLARENVEGILNGADGQGTQRRLG